MNQENPKPAPASGSAESTPLYKEAGEDLEMSTVDQSSDLGSEPSERTRVDRETEASILSSLDHLGVENHHDGHGDIYSSVNVIVNGFRQPSFHFSALKPLRDIDLPMDSRVSRAILKSLMVHKLAVLFTNLDAGFLSKEFAKLAVRLKIQNPVMELQVESSRRDDRRQDLSLDDLAGAEHGQFLDAELAVFQIQNEERAVYSTLERECRRFLEGGDVVRALRRLDVRKSKYRLVILPTSAAHAVNLETISVYRHDDALALANWALKDGSSDVDPSDSGLLVRLRDQLSRQLWAPNLPGMIQALKYEIDQNCLGQKIDLYDEEGVSSHLGGEEKAFQDRLLRSTKKIAHDDPLHGQIDSRDSRFNQQVSFQLDRYAIGLMVSFPNLSPHSFDMMMRLLLVGKTGVEPIFEVPAPEPNENQSQDVSRLPPKRIFKGWREGIDLLQAFAVTGDDVLSSLGIKQDIDQSRTYEFIPPNRATIAGDVFRREATLFRLGLVNEIWQSNFLFQQSEDLAQQVAAVCAGYLRDVQERDRQAVLLSWIAFSIEAELQTTQGVSVNDKTIIDIDSSIVGRRSRLDSAQDIVALTYRMDASEAARRLGLLLRPLAMHSDTSNIVSEFIDLCMSPFQGNWAQSAVRSEDKGRLAVFILELIKQLRNSPGVDPLYRLQTIFGCLGTAGLIDMSSALRVSAESATLDEIRVAFGLKSEKAAARSERERSRRLTKTAANERVFSAAASALTEILDADDTTRNENSTFQRMLDWFDTDSSIAPIAQSGALVAMEQWFSQSLRSVANAEGERVRVRPLIEYDSVLGIDRNVLANGLQLLVRRYPSRERAGLELEIDLIATSLDVRLMQIANRRWRALEIDERNIGIPDERLRALTILGEDLDAEKRTELGHWLRVVIIVLESAVMLPDEAAHSTFEIIVEELADLVRSKRLVVDDLENLYGAADACCDYLGDLDNRAGMLRYDALIRFLNQLDLVIETLISETQYN